jgi:hypothetical protein
MRCGVIKLPSVIVMNTPDGATELSRHPRKEVRNTGEGVRLTTERKGSQVV